MIIFGIRSHVKEMAVKLLCLCPHCHTQNLTMGCVIRYFHIYFIPVFPVSNTKVIVCNYCKNQRNHDDFTAEEQEISKGEVAKKVLKTPWWAFIGFLLVLLVIVTSILS